VLDVFMEVLSLITPQGKLMRAALEHN